MLTSHTLGIEEEFQIPGSLGDAHLEDAIGVGQFLTRAIGHGESDGEGRDDENGSDGESPAHFPFASREAGLACHQQIVCVGHHPYGGRT